MRSFLQYLLEQNTESPAPYGVLKITHPDGSVQHIVGVHHTKKVQIRDPELKSVIKEHGEKHGYYYEGTGNDTDIKQSVFELHNSNDYRDGWDQDHAQTIGENGIKPHHLSLITGNVDVNWKHGGISKHFTDPKQTVFDGILNFYKKNKIFGEAQVTPEHVEKFLQANGPETGVDWLHLARNTPATQGKEFLKRIEAIAWPSNWDTKSRTTGPEQLVDKMSTERNEHLLGMGPGVYFAGAGHLLQIKELLKQKGINYTLHGGEQAHE